MTALPILGVESIRPGDVQQHLVAKGWQRCSDPANDIVTYELNTEQGQVKTRVLLSRDFADYAKRTEELVMLLSKLENRSPWNIAEELSTPPGDTIQFRWSSASLASGTISLDRSLRVRKAQKDLLLAGAHSVLEPRGYFPRMARSEALRMLSECREGQTERGSYLTKVVVPVPPAIPRASVAEPFGRRVVTRIVDALQKTDDAIQKGEHGDVLDAHRVGISANFLQALLDMEPDGDQASLEIGVQWSRARPPSDASRKHVFRFGSGCFEPFLDIIAALKDKTPAPNYEVEGYIAKLIRTEQDAKQTGIVVIATTIEDHPGTATVKVELPSDEYEEAANAHAKACSVRVVGTLTKKGRSWWLNRPTRLEVIPSEDDELESDFDAPS